MNVSPFEFSPHEGIHIARVFFDQPIQRDFHPCQPFLDATAVLRIKRLPGQGVMPDLRQAQASGPALIFLVITLEQNL
jgi:hypothetical protein